MPTSLPQAALPGAMLAAPAVGGSMVQLLMVADGCCRSTRSHSPAFHCRDSEAGPGFEGLETLIILEAYFKEKDTKFKI